MPPDGWKDVSEEKIWPVAYETEKGTLLYVEDELERQTRLTEDYWGSGRYNVKHSPSTRPGNEIIAGFDDVDEAEAYISGLMEKF